MFIDSVSDKYCLSTQWSCCWMQFILFAYQYHTFSSPFTHNISIQILFHIHRQHTSYNSTKYQDITHELSTHEFADLGWVCLLLTTIHGWGWWRNIVFWSSSQIIGMMHKLRMSRLIWSWCFIWSSGKIYENLIPVYKNIYCLLKLYFTSLQPKSNINFLCLFVIESYLHHHWTILIIINQLF